MKMKNLKKVLLIFAVFFICGCNAEEAPDVTTKPPSSNLDYFGNEIDILECDESLGDGYYNNPFVNVAILEDAKAFNSKTVLELSKVEGMFELLKDSLDKIETAEFVTLETDDVIEGMTVTEAETMYMWADKKQGTNYYDVYGTRVKFSGEKTLKGYITIRKNGDDSEVLFFPDSGEWSGMPCIVSSNKYLPLCSYGKSTDIDFKYLSRCNYIILSDNSEAAIETLIKGDIYEGDYRHATVTFDDLTMRLGDLYMGWFHNATLKSAVIG